MHDYPYHPTLPEAGEHCRAQWERGEKLARDAVAAYHARRNAK